MTKYFIYARKSSDSEDRQMLSIEAQLEELREYAKQEGLEIVKEFTESKTAKAPGREIFNQMLIELEQGHANAILAWHPDRCARNMLDGGKLLHLIDQNIIIDLKFPTFHFDKSANGIFNLSIAFSQAQYFIQGLRENVKRGIRQKVRRGEFPGMAPLGYINHPKTRTIEPDPELFDTIKYFLEKYAENSISQAQLREEMFKAGIKTKYDKPLHYASIRNLLTNPFYYGVFRLKGELHQGSHQAMISKETFDKIQARFNSNPKKLNFNKYKKSFLFPGIAQCGDCDYQITYEQHTKKSGLVFKYYRCSDKKPSYRCSQRKYLSETKLAEQIKKLVSRVALDDERCEMLTEIAHKMNKDEQRLSSSQSEKLNQDLQITKDKLNKLLDLHLNGDIDIENFKEKKNTLIEQKANLDAQITKISQEGNLWLEPTLSFIKSCNQANKFIESNNFTEMNKFIQKLGSNRKITKQKLAIQFLGPFNQLSELRQLPMMCSSTADNHSSVFSETQSGGGWEYKKRSRRRPTDLGIPGCVSGSSGCQAASVTAEMPIRADSEVSYAEWCP